MGTLSRSASLTVAPPLLTAYQVQVLQWVADGKRNEDIAELLSVVNPSSIQACMTRIMEATGSNTRAAAVAWGIRRGVIV